MPQQSKVELTWINHASFRIAAEAGVVYIDPWKVPSAPHDATLVLVSHSHYDHLSSDDIAKVSGPDALVAGPADVVEKLHKGFVLLPGKQVRHGGLTASAVPAYNVNKKFHPKSNQWLGFVVEIASRRIYYAGDTDKIEEMADIGSVDVALLPAGGTYTMTAAEAAQAAATFQPRIVVPYHWGDVVGSRADAEALKKTLGEKVTILQPSQSLTL